MLRLAIPIGTILFCWLTARAEVDFVDGPTLNLYGFPLPWHRWSAVSSLQSLVDLPALATDYIVYVLGVSAALRSSLLERIRSKVGPSALLIVWATAVVSLGWLALSLMGDLSFGNLATGAHRVTAYAPHIGTGYPY